MTATRRGLRSWSGYFLAMNTALVQQIANSWRRRSLMIAQHKSLRFLTVVALMTAKVLIGRPPHDTRQIWQDQPHIMHNDRPCTQGEKLIWHRWW